ncbi:MAG: sugar transferase [Negativicutes bacterium]|jgi:O-antigen biosynthesis protein WbqP
MQLREMWKRLFDTVVSFFSLLLFFIPMLIIYLLIISESNGASFFIQKRVGKGNIEFNMYKFRSMVVGTPNVATDKLLDSNNYVTRIGKIIRKYSLDELPQLWNIFKGDMSIVGPRPALYNQYDLRDTRNKLGISILKPGLTGWAQINGRDDISLDKKIELDYYYLRNQSLWFDFKIIVLTFLTVFSGTGTNPR